MASHLYSVSKILLNCKSFKKIAFICLPFVICFKAVDDLVYPLIDKCPSSLDVGDKEDVTPRMLLERLPNQKKHRHVSMSYCICHGRGFLS